MKIKKVQSVCLILACVAATGLTGCGKTDRNIKETRSNYFYGSLYGGGQLYRRGA